MLHHLKLSLFGMSTFAIVLVTGCTPQPQHPNQLNAFDGATYNSLTLAHAALASFRVQVSTALPQYAPAFNEAAAAYATAFETYASFRSQPSSRAAVTIAITNLTAWIVALENAFAKDMHANSQTMERIRHKAVTLRTQAGRNVTISDILTELEIAASIAEAIPAGQPYAQLAAVVIEATSQALVAEDATAGQPIDLSTIQPVAPIS
jgi:hypothetical protein